MSAAIEDRYCPEPVLWTFDDGSMMHGTCNQPSVADWPTCAKHTPDKETLTSISEECEHGLSAWLCADPIYHYPADQEW